MSPSHSLPSGLPFEGGLSVPAANHAQSSLDQSVEPNTARNNASVWTSGAAAFPPKQPPTKGPDPAWLLDLLPDSKLHRQWIRNVIAVLGLGSDGAGLSCTFECLAGAFKAAAKPLEWPVLAEAAQLLMDVANRAKATTRFPLLALVPDVAAASVAQSVAKVGAQCAGGATEARPAQVALALLALDALRMQRAMSKRDVDHCATFAGACQTAYDARYSPLWRDLAALSPFAPSDLAPFTFDVAQSAPALFARRLSRVEWRATMDQLHYLVQGAAGTATSSAHAVSRREGSGGVPSTALSVADSVCALQPSVRGSRASAKFAGMAEHFGVGLVLNRLPPEQLIRVTKACHRALRAGQGRQADLALLVTMSLFISHDFKYTLNLPLMEDVEADLWYSRKDRCLYVDRNALQGKATGASRRTWDKRYIPPEVAERIEVLASKRGSARRLHELLPHQDHAELCRAAERWTKGLTDSAHPGWSARVAHSQGLAYLHVGASDVEAATLSLNLPLAVLSVQNYYQPDRRRQFDIASRLFEALGYEQPAWDAGDGRHVAPEVPTDDDMRREWARVACQYQLTLEGLPGADPEAAIALFNAFMVAASRAETLLTGARSQRRENPRLKDVLGSGTWCFRSDKRTKPSSDRLLPMSLELADLVRAVCLIRDMARARLLQLGVCLQRVHDQLIEPRAESSLFLFLLLHSEDDGYVVSSRPIEDPDMQAAPQLWPGPPNMGRRFWVREASQSAEWMVERVLTGHAQGLHHPGSGCLCVPVVELLQGAKRLTTSTLERLNLPRLCSGVDVGSAMPALVTDLRRYGSRKSSASVQADLPSHYCDHLTLAALRVVEALRLFVGRASQLSAGARTLLSLVVVDGLCHTADLQSAWRALMNSPKSTPPRLLAWERPTGQPIAMPLMPPTQLAAAAVQRWLVFSEVQVELAAWLAGAEAHLQIGAVVWPEKHAAVLVALCALMARWVRLHVPPFLVEAYRPEVLAATMTGASLDQIHGAPAQPRRELEVRAGFRETKAALKEISGSEDQMAGIQFRLGRLVNSTSREGEHRARAANVWRDGQLRAWHEVTEFGAARWMLTWVFRECELIYGRRKGALDPATIYDYLSLVRVAVGQHWPSGCDPELASAAQWRFIAQQINASWQHEEAVIQDSRRKALRRILRTLAELPLYGACATALDLIEGDRRVPCYVPSAASTIVTAARVQQVHAAIDCYLADEPLASAQAHALLDLLSEVGLRKSEACAPQHENLAKDGTFLVKAGNGFDLRKTARSSGPTALSAATGDRMLALQQVQRQLHPPHKFFFAQSEDGVDLAHAQALYAVVVQLTKQILGSEAVHGHSYRGSAAMRLLVPGWEDRLGSLSSTPFLLSQAQAVMQAMRGSGVAHLATVLSGLGHASHRTFVRRYCTAWPLFYASAMRASLADVELNASLIHEMPHLRGDRAAAARSIACRRSFVYSRPSGQPRDDWTWAVSHHYGNWRRDLRGTAERPCAKPAAKLLMALSPPKEKPPRDVEIHYLFLLALGLTSVAAMQKLGIGLTDGARLSNLMPGLPTLAELQGARNPKQIPAKFRSFMLGMSDKGACQALIRALSKARHATLLVLMGQLADHAGAPKVTAQGLRTCLQALPSQFALELAMVEAHWLPELPVALADESRIRIKPLARRKSRRVRVRLCRDEQGSTPANFSCALTLAARFCAAAAQELLHQEDEQ